MKRSENSQWIAGVVFMFAFVANPVHAQNKATVAAPKNGSKEHPNVIMFVMDDLNDWVGPLGCEQAITPNLDRLAKSGITFMNAHTPGVFCAPARSAIWTGLQASTTGCYEIEVYHYDYPDLIAMQMAFQQGGYSTFGAGKLFHHRSGYVDLRGWDEYFSRSQEMRDMGWEMNGYHMTDVPLPDPYPYSPYYTKTGRKIESAGHLEWGPIANEQEDDMVDAMRTNWGCDVLKRKHAKPLFLALGMYSPHYPNYAPQKYFDLYDRDKIELPPYKAGDLDDLSPAIKKFYTARSKQHKELEELGVLKDAMHAYLASVSFADAMLGRVMDAVETSPYKDNTIIVIWSDQGFHHGEKEHWGKHTLWQRTTRVPFIWAGKGIPEKKKVDTTVSLIDMYPTFIELCNLPVHPKLDGTSMASILKDPSTAVDRDVFIPDHHRGGYAVVNMNWRYIQYEDGAEELYKSKVDPNEWNNLAKSGEYKPVMQAMRKAAPAEFAPSATDSKTLKLVVEGDSFHWEKKKK
jgi:arylsulfatase A-like enzyme